MEERSQGLIIRVRPLTDTSLIVHWISRDLGRLATVAKGARRPKSPLAGKLDLYYLADFSFIRSRRSELHVLREAVILHTYPAMRREWRYLQQAAYGSSLIELHSETETPIPELFDLLAGLLAYLPQQPPQALTILALEMKFLGYAGLGPDLERAPLSAGSQQILRQLGSLDWQKLGRLRATEIQILEMNRYLEGFMVSQFGRLPHGRSEAM